MFPYLERTPIAFAHRGGAAVFPENTLASFQGAIDLGFRHIETDLHVTRDGHVVCAHDATLSRCTDGVGRLKDLTLRELRTLDAGYRFTPDGGETYPYRGRGLHVPTLEEALALHPGLHLNVEMKQREPSMEATLWREIDRLAAHDRLLVAAEYDPLVHRFRALRPEARMPTSPGVRGVIQFWFEARAPRAMHTRPPFDALQVPVSWNGLIVVDEGFVQRAHALGVQVHVWTIDDPDEMRRLLDLGVDGLMTDQPAVLRQVFVERGLWT